MTSEKVLGKDMRSLSPFRYPGGKAFLAKYLEGRLSLIATEDRHYAEPFCGGAGAALLLLHKGVVNRLHLNDADIRIYSAWRAMIEDTDRFIVRIADTNVSMDTFHWACGLVNGALPDEYDFELGFATFFLNRTSRSGIVVGAGPIGGYNQKGNWKIDARYNKMGLINRVSWLGQVRSQIQLTNEDGLVFLSRSVTRTPVDRTLFFVDPPYVKAGGRLYLDAMNELKHIALSDILQAGKLPHWVLTYDDHPLIRSAYGEQIIEDLQVSYSLQMKRKEREILVVPRVS